MAKRVIIVGGGIVGLATAYRLRERFPDAAITVLDKEKGVGRHQSSHNSGVLHCGLYYKPGSLRARLAVSGIRQMVAFCEENAVPHEVCGKLVVAITESEVHRLRSLQERGTANGLQGLRWLHTGQIREIEPHAAGIAALWVPQEGIVDYPRVCETLARKIAESGTNVVTGAQVQQLKRKGGGWLAHTTAGSFEGDFLINCAGLHCDRVAQLAGESRQMRILPFRGEYYKLKPEREHLVRNLIYPVPDPRFPFLGVHCTRLIRGGIECGPNAVLAFAREGYRKTNFNARDLFDALFYRGFRRFLWRHRGTAWFELRRSLSRRLFARSLQRLVPEIQTSDLARGGSGVRAQAISPEGEIYQDFYLLLRPNALHVLSAPSPAATASLAIGAEIVSMAEKAGLEGMLAKSASGPARKK
jgi:(S)-2-hydroxyglutarate dehydrogenase